MAEPQTDSTPRQQAGPCQRPRCNGTAEYGVEAVPLHRGKLYRMRTDLSHRWCYDCAYGLVHDEVIGRIAGGGPEDGA